MTPTIDDPDIDVELENLSYSYGGETRAVDAVSLRVRRGEIHALLGTNGAGKTTTLEMIQGTRRPTSGDVRVLGQNPGRRGRTGRALRRKTGFMLQESGFIPELTPGETLRVWQRISSRTDSPRRLLERVGLTRRADVAVSQLSGGEKRRLDVALTIWGRPRLVVLDEPTTGLDPESRLDFWALVRGLRDEGTTVILTTHYLDEAEALCDRVAIMHEGSIALAGTLAELTTSYPATIDVSVPMTAREGIPELAGTVSCTGQGPDQRLRVATHDLQRDLTVLMRWADDGDVPLRALHAQPATLESLFLSVTNRGREAA